MSMLINDIWTIPISFSPMLKFALESLFLVTVIAGIDVLKDLGLSKSEMRAYGFLINRGESGAEAISKKTGIPISKIYTILNHLSSKRLIHVNKLKTPNRYMVRNPKIAIGELAHERKIQVTEEFREIEKNALEFAENIMGIYTSKEDSINDELLWELRCGEPSYDRLRMLIATAEEEVVFIGEIANEVISSLSFEDALERGVSFRGVAQKDTIVHINRHCSKPIKDLLNSSNQEDTNTSFMIVDQATLLLSIIHPSTKTLFITIDTNNEEAIYDFYLFFKMIWDASLNGANDEDHERRELEIAV